MCMATNATPPAAATSASEADTSLTMRAPAATAASATSGLRVSIDTATPSAASAATTGTHPAQLLVHRHGLGPGRVDSPPTSTQSAPSADDLAPVRERGVMVEVAPAVRERIRGHVDDTHDQGADDLHRRTS